MMQKLYIVLLENDHEVYCSDAYVDQAGAEEQLALVKSEWTERYGADGFDDMDQDDWRVEVLDGPSARIVETSLNTGDAGLIPHLAQAECHTPEYHAAIDAAARSGLEA